MGFLGNLIQQCTTDISRSEQPHADSLVREEETGMECPQGLLRILFLDDDTDIPLRGTLGDGTDIDMGFSQSAEESTRNPGYSGHPLTYCG